MLIVDIGRMYKLVSNIHDGFGKLKSLLESHIANQGLSAIEKCCDTALSVSFKMFTNISVEFVLRIVLSCQQCM